MTSFGYTRPSACTRPWAHAPRLQGHADTRGRTRNSNINDSTVEAIALLVEVCRHEMWVPLTEVAYIARLCGVKRPQKLVEVASYHYPIAETDDGKWVALIKDGLSEEVPNMPVRKTSDGKWTFGGAKYDSKKKAERAYRAYLAAKHAGMKKKGEK